MSNVKDKLTTDDTHGERERVQREQEYVKEKGHEVASAAKQVKHGDAPHVEMPSNERVVSALQHGQESLEKLQNTDRGTNMTAGGDKVVEDLKRVLSDQQAIAEKNEGDVLQNLVRDFWALLQELKQRSDLKVFFEEWQGTLTSVFSSGDFTQFFHQTGDMFTSMRDTDEFLSLASELIDLMKIGITETTEKVVEGDTAAKEEYRTQRQAEKHKVTAELRRTLGAIAQNDIWIMLVRRGKGKVNQVQGNREASAVHASDVIYRVRESPNFLRLLDDFKLLLQRLVGQQMSVDPLFDYSKKALDTISNDEDLASIVQEMQELLPRTAEQPALLEDPTIQRQMDLLARKADEVINRLKNNVNVQGAKDESAKVMAAIKNEPTSNKLLTDLKTLWSDVISGKSDEVIDPDVLRSLRQLIVPLLVEHLNNVPLPSVSDQASFLGKYVYTIDNMKISLPELIPENIHLRFEYELDANPLELEAHNQHTFLYLQASHIQLRLRDCNFVYERLTIPKHKDSGVFDVDTVGEGLTAWMKMELKSDASKGQYLDVLKSDVKISKFHVTFRDSKHDHLYEMLTHMFSRKIKSGVIDMLQNKLRTFGSYFNEQIITIINQAKSSSSSVARIAKDKTEQARQGVEKLKVQAQERKNDPEVQEKKEEAKSTAKSIVGVVSGLAIDKLDEAQVKIENQKREKELDRALGNPAYEAPNTVAASPIHSAHPPPVVTPATHDSPIPFTSARPASPSLLSNSSSTHLGSYSSPHGDHLHHESTQFSPAFPLPAYGGHSQFESSPAFSYPKSTAPSTTSDAHDPWIAAKPVDLEKPSTNPKDQLQSL